LEIASARDSKSAGSDTAASISVVASTTTSGASAGDHRAGAVRGSDSGAVGKAKAPPPGQTLPFYQINVGVCCDTGFGFCIVTAVVGIALQILLRKIRIVMVLILICGRW
jgi:hypothetical protein